ncbi:outer dense fiber protein 3-B [Musca domestica]|uniref:Outer dense fiber protein 3-B n=1 Tax=Musca domestica TaxID=7370 RepID=A0A1I8M2Y3_MUSDO|nr:outer dense fiber protein 3-B [Musca domestica]
MASAGPGPVYSLPPTIGYDNHDQRKIRMPQYSFGGRTKLINKNIVPGPGLNVSGLTRYGPARTFAYSIGPRTFMKDSKNIGPGPANYDLNKSPYVNTTSPPSYSIGRRTMLTNKNICPGPNAYGISVNAIKTAAPAFSIGMRTGLKAKSLSPGPANYGPSTLKTYLPKAPEYSLAPRTFLNAKLVGPAANAYDCMNYKPGKTPPNYSFGVRHSPRAPPMIVACDNT